MGDPIAGVVQHRALGLREVPLADVGQMMEALRRRIAGIAAQIDGQPLGLQMVDDRLDAFAPGRLQDFGVQQRVRQLAEQVRRHPAPGGVAVHADQGEAVVLDGGAAVLDHRAQLIVVEIAVERGLGDFRLLLLVGQTGKEANCFRVSLPWRSAFSTEGWMPDSASSRLISSSA